MTKNVLEVAMERAKRLKYLQPFLHSPTEAQLVAMADEIQRLHSDYATLEAKRCREVEHGGKLVTEIERLRTALRELKEMVSGNLSGNDQWNLAGNNGLVAWRVDQALNHSGEPEQKQ